MSTRNKWVVATVATLVVIAGAAVVLWPRPPAEAPDPTHQTPDEVRGFLASPEFGKLSDDDKRTYFEAVRQNDDGNGPPRLGMRDLPEEQRRQLMQNMRPLFEKMMNERIDAYFALPQEEQVTYLDAIIDEMQKHRRQREERRAERPPPPESPAAEPTEPGLEPEERHRSHFTAEHLKEMIETTDPETRARRAEFMKAMRQRLDERGISHPFGGHPRP